MKRWISIVFLFFGSSCCGQKLLAEYQILLSNKLSSSENNIEVSASTSYQGQLLLIGSFKSTKWSSTIIAVDTFEIAKSISDPRHVIKHSFLTLDSTSFLPILKDIRQFDGFEAAIFVPQSKRLYLLIETNVTQKYCHIIRCRIESDIVICERASRIRRPSNVLRQTNNVDSGFESVSVDYSGRGLIAIYEFADEIKKGFYFSDIDLDLMREEYHTNNFLRYDNARVNSRISDVCGFSKGKFFGILSHYSNSARNRSELVLIDLTLGEVVPAFPDHFLCIGFGCENNNWEGISKFRNGFVLVSDNRSGPNNVTTTRLSFFRLKNR